MKLLYMQEYIERHLYVIEHEGKYIMVYRSSGLSGTGHEGKLLPFSGLDSGRGLRSHPGYVYKEMFYNGKFRNHNKRLGLYEEVEDNMQKIDDFIRGRTPDVDVHFSSFFTEDGREFKNYRGFIEYVEKTNENLRNATKGLEPFDLMHKI